MSDVEPPPTSDREFERELFRVARPRTKIIAAVVLVGLALALVGGFFYLRFQPFEKLSTSLGLTYYDFFRSDNGELVYDYTIWRSRTTLQLNRYLFFRAIFEYNHYWKKINADFLASFTYIPGTVIYFGYGSVYERIIWNHEDRDYFPSDDYLQTKRSFFFKASYLWRF